MNRLKINFIIIIFCALLLLTACDAEPVSGETAPNMTAETLQPPATASESQPSATQTPLAQCTPDQSDNAPQPDGSGFFPWIVYWDYETAISESSNVLPIMGSISVFAAYFQEDDTVMFPQSSQDTLDAVRNVHGTQVKTYLTFVNDIKYNNGESSLKDVDLLRRLFSNETSRDAHIDEIIALAKLKGVNGIEIDYENIKGDDALWQLFSQFLTELNSRVSSEGLSLRIVLETSALGKAPFPAGPEYVVMVYNLYGNHSAEPGPKADEDFILETAAKSICLGPNVSFAFATGGFDWSSSGEITQLCETAAIELAKTTQSTPVRDQKSGAMHFSYQNEATHTVWYADGETLCFWMDSAKKEGIKNFALWRLGGNSADSLQKISAYFNNDK